MNIFDPPARVLTRVAKFVLASLLWAFPAVFCTTANAAGGPEDWAQEILQATGTTGGVVVHLGCGDGKLTAALRADESLVVQGLDRDATDVQAAREYVQSLGLYGSVSVEQLASNRLPYVDNLIRLVVVEDLSGVSQDDVMRVLAPLGVAYVRQGSEWAKTVKPWPQDIDEWQQHYHDADNNAVAKDSVVGPPRHYQWINEPQWTRSHLTLPSINSLISSQGRLFTVEDQGSAEHPALPGKFALVARDAFSGVVLWQHSFPNWHPVNVYIKYTPAQLQRRLAAIGDTVYCTPGLNAPVTALNAATGEVLRVYEGTERTQEFVFDRGMLYVVIGDPVDTLGVGDPHGGLGSSQFPVEVYSPEIPKLADPVSSILAIAADTGKPLWEKSGDATAGYQGTSLAVRGAVAAYCTTEAVVCLDRETGEPRWQIAADLPRSNKPGTNPSLLLSDDAIYLAHGNGTAAYALNDGAKLWTGKASLNHFKGPDLFLANGVVWSSYYTGYDPQTGEVVKTLSQQMNGPMGHDRCYRNRITEKFYINTKTGGSDFLSLDDSTEFPNPWARSTCGIGHLPCNGMLYLGPPACSCCNWVMLNGLNALTTEPEMAKSDQPVPVKTRVQLEPGPAYETPSLQTPGSSLASPSDWPTHRHNAERTGCSPVTVPATLKPSWEAKLSSKSSSPVIAAGMVFVADIDAHAVCALDATSGQPIWRYTTGGRVDSPPTYHQGALLFGSHDGWVYCLRAADGELVWRFRGLPERTICAYGQLESAWPVCGSVMVKDNVAYFAAGRNSFLDGGVFLYGLDPRTGSVVYQHQMHGPYGDDGFPILMSNLASGNGLDGFKNDVFLTDGKLLYLRQQAFQPDLTPLKPEEIQQPHLIPSAGFLEAIPHHRTFWTIDTTIRYDIAASRGAAHGDILVMDGSDFWEVRGYAPGRASNFDPRPSGYTLFAGTCTVADTVAEADDSTPKSTVTDSPAGKKKRRGTTTPAPKKERAASRVAAVQRWSTPIPLTGQALARAGDVLFVAGTPVEFPADDLAAAYEGRLGGVLWAVSAATGEKLAEYKLDAPPAWDGLAVANGRLFLSLRDGRVICMSAE